MTAPYRTSPLKNIKPSPRVKMALRLLVTGACKTKREASVAAGLHPNYLTMLTSPNNGSDRVKAALDELDAMMTDTTVDMSVVVQRLGRLGLGKLAHLALTGGNERIQLDAAKSLADRSPETAGIQKIQNDGLTIAQSDAKLIADAMVESALARQRYAQVGREGLVEVDISQGATSAMPGLPPAKGETAEGEGQAHNEGQADGPPAEDVQGPLQVPTSFQLSLLK